MSTRTPTYPHVYTANDTLPEIAGVLRNVDITGYTINLNLKRPDGTEIQRAGTIVDAPNGTFKFVWQTGDLVAGCGQLVQIEIIDTGGNVLTAPEFLLDVVQEITP